MKNSQLSNKELHEKCSYYGNLIKKYKNKFIALIPEVNRRRVYEKHGMNSIYEYAAKHAGLSHDTIRKVLKLDIKLKDKVILKELFESGEVGWSKIKTVLPIITSTNEKEMAEKITKLSNLALETLVRDYKSDHVVGFLDENTAKYFNKFENFTAKLDPKIVSQLKVLQAKLAKRAKKQLTWNQTIKEMIKIVDQQVSPKQNKDRTILKKQSRHIPSSIKREAIQKTNGLCANKNCSKPAKHFHHEIPYSKYPFHENIMPLCKEHHELEHQSESYIDTSFRKLKFANLRA